MRVPRWSRLRSRNGSAWTWTGLVVDTTDLVKWRGSGYEPVAARTKPPRAHPRPAFPNEVAAATGFNWRTCSAVLDRLCKEGVVIRSDEGIARDKGSAYLYSTAPGVALGRRREVARALVAAGEDAAADCARWVALCRLCAIKRSAWAVIAVRKQTVYLLNSRWRAAIALPAQHGRKSVTNSVSRWAPSTVGKQMTTNIRALPSVATTAGGNRRNGSTRRSRGCGTHGKPRRPGSCDYYRDAATDRPAQGLGVAEAKHKEVEHDNNLMCCTVMPTKPQRAWRPPSKPS